jgi:hypothetical protein
VFLSSLSNFEKSLLAFTGDPGIAEFLTILGVGVGLSKEAEGNSVVIPAPETTFTVYDFQKISSVLCAYRLFEVISLQHGAVSRVSASPPIPMFLPELAGSKDDLYVCTTFVILHLLMIFHQCFFRLHDWPKLLTSFKKTVTNKKDKSTLPMETFSTPILSLMQMASKSLSASKYHAVEENFLVAAIHIAAMKDIHFAKGLLPDLPSDMPLVPSG